MKSSECRVLIVEDDADTREALAAALTDAGFGVEQAASGAQGIERVAACKPDVILLDMRLPDMGGEQFIEQTRDSGARVVVLSAEAPTRLLRFAQEAKVLQKPVDLDALEHAVKEACAA
jgi:DNA-binding response OmpR family regulator